MPQQAKRFEAIAQLCVKSLEREIEQGIRVEINWDYVRVMNSTNGGSTKIRPLASQLCCLAAKAGDSKSTLAPTFDIALAEIYKSTNRSGLDIIL